ncbi:MAG: acyl-CoA thioesterase [Verrucomicrobiota bacterium]
MSLKFMASSSTSNLPRWFGTILWGNSVALSWMWGLGLFFSVQFTTQFGVFGLLTFAIPNFLGLLCFGLVTHHLARRQQGSDSLAQFFSSWSRPFRLVFFLYQILAITLTIFAFLRYVWQPLGLEPWLLYLPLTLLVVLAASILFGEEFDIKRIKFSHGVMFLLVAPAVAFLIIHAAMKGTGPLSFPKLPTNDWNYWGYAVPIIIGFLVGPWLDLQQWQRAIQMHRERVSIAAGYWIGSVLFFLLLMFHGLMTVWALNWGAAQEYPIRVGITGYQYGEEILMRYFSQAGPWTFAAYGIFVSVCVLSTLDSGYIALRWFLQSNAKTSNHPIFSLVSPKLLTSPIPVFLLCGLVALAGTLLKFELEFFMIFYATFFVGYSTLAIVRCYLVSRANAIPQIKMFCIGSLAVVIFSYGYFLRSPFFQILGSLLPLGYVLWLLVKPSSSEEFLSDKDELEAPVSGDAASAGAVMGPPSGDAGPTHVIPTADDIAAFTHSLGGHFEGKWFVHSFVATYGDTNSVGNVYFGMYAMWVGKTRELFFNRLMPKFNLKSTPYYILTRSFEHKFVRETREFETVSVKIRVAGYNRKFATLEHEIFDSAGHVLGRGKQTLLFVSSSDYKMLDIPPDVYSAFIAHT